jgi:hypothetical protein
VHDLIRGLLERRRAKAPQGCQKLATRKPGHLSGLVLGYAAYFISLHCSRQAQLAGKSGWVLARDGQQLARKLEGYLYRIHTRLLMDD